jgi:SfnB family sulfur acquisition oxidoreductase
MLQTVLSQEHLVLSSEEHTDYVLPRPLPIKPAHRITTDAEAIDIANRLAKIFAEDAARRDRDRLLPVSLLDTFSQSGLWGISVPRAFGGAELSYITVAEVFAIIAQADSSLAQIAQNHFVDIDTVKWAGTESQKNFFFSEALYGIRFGNAFAEGGSGQPTKLSQVGDMLYLNGRKFYCTGALLAHWVQVGAVDDDGQNVLAFIRRDAPGLTIVDDWSGFGQRTTASGSAILKNVPVEQDDVVQSHLAFSKPTINGPLSQLIHAAIDLGIARSAIDETLKFVRTSSRPWPDANVESASDDPLTVVQVGDLAYRLHSAEAMLNRAGRNVDLAAARPTDITVAQASIAVAEAKIATTELAILASNKLFELAGTKSTLEKFRLDRHWRDARTHTLHDPVRWKYHAVGNYYLNGVLPARHGWI